MDNDSRRTLLVRREFICPSCDHLISLHVSIGGKITCHYQPDKKNKCGCSLSCEPGG